MAERQRRSWWPFGRNRSIEVGAIRPTRSSDTLDWDGKALASLSKIASSTSYRQSSKGADTEVSYSLLRSISLKSEVVNAILRRTVDDCLANGYEFILNDGIEQGNEAQLTRLRDFFQRPNPDDMGDEWLEALIYDLALFGDAYIELDGTRDTASNNEEDWNFGGMLQAVWPIPAEYMRLVPAARTPSPPEMAYIQSIGKNQRRFSSDKVIHLTKFKHGRGYGTSPLLPLLNTIAGQLNLSNYLNEMFTGTLPKTILNVGDISNAEMKSMLNLLESQLSGGKSPFGLVAINGGSGFNMHRLIDSTKDGQQLDLLYYYREEICAVFGIPPMKLGWVQTGKLANPEQQLEAWYDVVESYQNRIENMINNRILPLLQAGDWRFKFRTIRPSREKERSETLRAKAQAIASLRQEAAISINEARQMLNLELLRDEEANDPFYLSPKLSINAGADNLDDDDDPIEPDTSPEPEEPEPEEVRQVEPTQSKRALTTKDRTPPQGVRTACKRGIELHEEGYSGDGLEPATVREAKAMARGTPITLAKAKKMIRWWGRNERFLDEEKDSPAWTAAMLWGGRPGLSWSKKLQRAIEADE